MLNACTYPVSVILLNIVIFRISFNRIQTFLFENQTAKKLSKASSLHKNF